MIRMFSTRSLYATRRVVPLQADPLHAIVLAVIDPIWQCYADV
jgi:hypothetical protein